MDECSTTELNLLLTFLADGFEMAQETLGGDEEGEEGGGWDVEDDLELPPDLVSSRDAIFPYFSGIPDFHKSKLSVKNLWISIQNWKM